MSVTGDVFDPSTHEMVTLNVEDTAGDTSTDPDVELTETLFRHYSDAAADFIQKGMDSKAFVHNIQYTSEQVRALGERGQAAIPINVLWPALEQAVAMLTANSPGFQATAEEDSDVGTAKAISDIFAHDWYKSRGDASLKETLYDYYQVGRGCMMAYIDPEENFGKGAVRYRSVDGLKVFPDPNSRDRLWRDASHVLTSEVMTGEKILSLWPDAKKILPLAQTSQEDEYEQSSAFRGNGNSMYDNVVDQHHNRYKVLTRYSRIKIRYVHVFERDTGEEKILLPEAYEQYLQNPAVIIQTPDGQRQYFVGDSAEQGLALIQQSQPTEQENVFVYTDPESQEQIILALTTHEALIDDRRIEARPTPQNRILYVITIGNQLYYRGYLPTKHYPIVPFNCRWDRNVYPMSDVEFVTPIQQSINKLHSQIIANLANSTNVKALVPRGSVDHEQVQMEFAKSGAALIEYDAEMGQPTIVSPLPVPQGLFMYFSELKGQIERELGIFSTQQGDPSGAPQTYKGTLAMDEYGQRRIKSKLDDIEDALAQLGRVGLDFAQFIYTDERVIRLLDANNSVRETVVNQWSYDDQSGEAARMNDLSLGQYDVRIVAGSTMPSNRWALLEYYMQLFQMGIIDQYEVLKKTDVADAEGVIERTGRIGQLEQELQGAQDQIKNLQGDLQTASREKLHALERLELEKRKTDLNAVTLKAKGAGQLYEARLQDELQMKRKEESSILPLTI